MTEAASSPREVTAIYAGIVGRLKEFDPRSDSLAVYVERAMLYMDANNIPEAKRAATLLSALGKNTYEVLRNLVLPARLQDQSLGDIIKVLSEHYEPKPLVISERFNFKGTFRLHVDSLRSRHSLPIREVEAEGTTLRQKVVVVQSGQYKKNLIIWSLI